MFDSDAVKLHMQALGKNGDTRLRAFYDKTDPRKAKDSGRKGRLSQEEIERCIKDKRGVYFVVNDGGDTDDEIVACRALFCEWDDAPKDWQVNAWQELGLPAPTIQIDSGNKSIHNYWRLSETITPEKWRELQRNLIALTGSDATLKNPSRVMRLAGCPHPTSGTVVSIISCSGDFYTCAELEAVLRLPEPPPTPTPTRTPRREFQPRTLIEVAEALQSIPPRPGAGSGTYGDYRNILWGLVKACEEAGGDIDDAIALMAAHSPDGWNVGQVARSGGDFVGAATFWWHAQEHGWNPPKPQKQRATVRTGEVQQGTVELIRNTFDQLLEAHPNDSRPRLVHRCRERVELDLDVRPTMDLYRRELAEAYLRRDGVEVRPFQPGDELPTEDLPCLVDGVFIQGALNIVGADPKCGKTQFVVSMLAALLHDTPTWLGRPVAAPPAVVLIGPDQPVSIWAKQLRTVGLLVEGRLHPRIVCLWDSTNPWAAGEEGLAELRALCLEHPGCLVVVDSLAKVCEKLGLDENSAEIGGVVSDIERAVVAAGGTPLMIHHNAKGASRNGVSGGSALRGSGTIRANASQVVSLSHINPDNIKDPRRRLTTEGRLGIPIDIVVEADWDTNTWRSVCDYAEVQQELRQEKKRRNLTELQEELLAVLAGAEGPVTTRWVYEQLYPDAAGYVARRTEARKIYNALQRLVRQDLAQNGPKVGTNRTFCSR